MGRGLDRVAVETKWESDHKPIIIMKMTKYNFKESSYKHKDIIGWNNKMCILSTITFEGHARYS